MSDTPEFPEHLRPVVLGVHFPGWTLDLLDRGGEAFLQWTWMSMGEVVHGRKWFLSRHSTRSEVVRTAFAALLMAHEHEAREQFMYEGRAVFGPHLDVDRLWGLLADHGAYDRRPGSEDVVGDER